MPAFKPDMSLCEVLTKFGDNDRCRAYLESLRWPDKVTCPKCLSEKISHIRDRHQYDCDSCRYQFSVTAGTIFHDSHLPLTKWFATVYLMCESRKGVSANQIKRMMGISYKTAWYLCHRIRAAMKAVNCEPLSGTVEMDETYIGGKVHGTRSWHKRHSNKEVVIGIRQRGGELRFFHAEDAKSGTLAKYVKENLSGDVDVVVTDELPAYHKALGELDARHQTVCHSAGEYVRGDIYTNTVESAFSLLKRGIIGSWHKISAKHLPAYLDEMSFRFNNRKNEFLFRDTLLKMIESGNVEYKELTSESSAA
ncbi:MAG TPA: IS1595 family transposase [Candidatus Angelobacter sp.]|nr:IS1595 family transposase [Candidatus Angelobacter sp.]